MWIAGISSIIGLVVTWALLPEPNGLNLEEASRDKSFIRERDLQAAII